jgi:hypothetical protein
MSTTYEEYDLDDGPMVVEPDDSRHFEFEPPPRPRPGRYGPTNGRDLDVDYDYAEEAERRGGGGMNAQAVTGVVVIGAGVASLIWVFAGPIAVVSVAGVAVVTAVGRKVVGWRRNRNRNGSGERRGWFNRRGRNGEGRGRGRGGNGPGRRSLAQMLGLGSGGGRAAAARRAGLLAGMGAGGLGGGRGRGGGRRGPGGPGGGGGGGRGPKPGPRVGPGGGGATPKRGGGLLGRLKPKGRGASAGSTSGSRSGPTPTKPRRAAGGGQHRSNPARQAGNPLSRMMPGAKGRAQRLAHKQAKVQKAAASQKARQAKNNRRDFRAKMKQARFQRRQLKRKNRTVRRRYRRQNPGFFRRGARDFGLGLLTIGVVGVGLPARLVYRRVLRPIGRFAAIGPSTALARWAARVYRGRRRAWMLRQRYRAIYVRPARREWLAGRWADFRAWVVPHWVMRLRQVAATRGRWIAGLALLALMLAGIVFAARKAREWAWDGKKARSVFDEPEPAQQNTEEPAQPDPAAQQQPDPQQRPSGVPDPSAEPRGNPWGYRPSRESTAEPAPGAVPNSTEGAPQMSMLTAQPGRRLNDRLEVPAGLHPVFGALCADARVLEGMFNPASFPDLTVYLNSLSTKIRSERDKWALVGDNLLSRFPGFNLAQEFAGEVHDAYSDLATRADNVFAGYKDKMDQTFARWLDPRVNEQYADVSRWPGVSGIDPITLIDGSKMHGSHTIWLTSIDVNLVGWFPDKGENNDYVIELLHWLQSLHPFFVARAMYAQNFVEEGLVQGFPIEDGVADITLQLARGFADLADRAHALAAGYEARNPYDMQRRYEPKVNEHKRDVGNDQMTHAGA